MLYSTLVIAAAAFTGFVSAQTTNYTTSGPLNVTASQIPLVQRQAWCRGQTNNCPLVCGGSASPNTCEPENLSYVCTCTDGSTPNITSYAEMLPAFICDQWISNCVNSHPNDLTGITACRSVRCGTRNASTNAAVSAAPSSTIVTSTTAAPSSTGAGAAATSPATSSRTGGAVTMHAESFGTAALTFVLLGMFGWAM